MTYKEWEKARKEGKVPPAKPIKRLPTYEGEYLDSVRDGSAC